MKSIAKKIVIFSMIGLMQVGLGASVIEASPRHDDKHQRYEQRERDRDRDRDHRIREEQRRHEREMQRRENEREQDWKERQQREKEHHEEVMRTLGGIAILALILSNN